MNKEELDLFMKSAKSATECLKALAHESRLVTVCFIGSGEKSVQELENLLGTTQSNVSQHLAKLRDKGVLETRKAGNQVFYRIKDPRVLDLIHVLQKIYCPI